MLLKALLALAGLVATARGHAAVTHPKPRQAIDGVVAPWNGTVPDPIPFTTPNWCAHPDAGSTDPRKLSGSNGQACFWVSTTEPPPPPPPTGSSPAPGRSTH